MHAPAVTGAAWQKGHVFLRADAGDHCVRDGISQPFVVFIISVSIINAMQQKDQDKGLGFREGPHLRVKGRPQTVQCNLGASWVA